MAKTDERELQDVETTQVTPATKAERIRAARRRFLKQALAATSGIALAELLPPVLLAADPQTATCTPGPDFIKIGEIGSNRTGKLQAVIKVQSGRDRIISTSPN